MSTPLTKRSATWARVKRRTSWSCLLLTSVLLGSCGVARGTTDFHNSYLPVLAALPLDSLCVKPCPIVGLDSVVRYRPALFPRYAPEDRGEFQLPISPEVRAVLEPRNVAAHSPWSSFEPIDDTVRVALYRIDTDGSPSNQERYGVAIMPPFGPTYVYDATVEKVGRGWRLATMRLFFAP